MHRGVRPDRHLSPMNEIDHVDGLFRLDPAEFVMARNQLARRLKDAGEVDRAAEILALRRPSKTAWALNVWARSDPSQVEALLAAANEVALAQRTGGQPLRDATTAYTDAIASAVDSAAERSGIDGEAMRLRLRATLLAAGADPDGAVADQLRSGALRSDAGAPGFSFGAAELTAEPTPGSPRRAAPERTSRPLRAVPDPDPDPDSGPDPGATAATAVDVAGQSRAAAADRARAAGGRKDRVRSTRRDVERLRTRSERLVHRAVESETQASEARELADAALGELREAQERLTELTGD